MIMSKSRDGLEKIIVAKPRGFCAGVERAVRTVDLLIEKYGPPLYVRHHIVHNDHVVKRFEKRGVIFVEDLNLVPDGARVVFSAHGSPPSLYELARKRHLQVIDATCPLVTKVHSEAKRFAADGYFIFYVGHKNHPETIGVLEEVVPTQVVLLETIADVWKIQPLQQEKLVVLNQTTLSVDDTKEIIEVLKDRFPNLIMPTGRDICYATQNRQDAVKALAKVVDLVLVVGSPTSSNSNRLKEVAEKQGVKAYLVNNKREIDTTWLKGVRVVGVTSGASVPDELVTALVESFTRVGVEVEELKLVDESRIHFMLPKEL
ncbi:4-hydroxy-3-methylbut-2-enyl diphosphate reductase [Candidatus Gottesmanbacteria bacterium RIFCSPLOWO2_01_FULL_49_10]|uniref:4-hydroxy-3-methylbut-2-enyl diphosphate reductase n=1 Tax=Candidatus Gottesmanbacteria bacterium RIFCSPLOWO2_01_FULL_49_10 TaxID=1798396 RepID=A0A1F6B1J1_9BACT|nr:MAG: 4-hydroxy-3-methylbut-2-enyl diphosphate reductase [Candidatus Gottesmanbacteria bacterium RIFCSPLOWO2_01_FULL_49_10]